MRPLGTHSHRKRILELCLAGALLPWGCQPENNRLAYRHMSSNQRLEARQRWDVVRSNVKLQLAQQHLAAHRLEDAEKVLEQALTLAPDNPQSYLLATRLRFEQGRLAEAREAIALAESLSSNDPEIQYFAGIVAQRYGDLQTALEHYATAAERAPNVAPYILAQAETLVALDRPAEALMLIEPRIRDFDGNAAIRMLAARINRILGLRGPAVEHCRAALQWCDDDPMTRVDIGLTLVWAEEHDEAIAVLRPLAEEYIADQAEDDVHPADNGWTITQTVIRALARAYLATERWREAQRTLKLLIVRDEQRPIVWYLYARAAFKLNDLAAATEALEMLHKKNAPRPETLLLAACVAFRRGDYVGTLHAAEEALKLNEQLFSAHCLIGQAAAALGQQERAQQAYADALTLDPHSEIARILLEDAQSSAFMEDETPLPEPPETEEPQRSRFSAQVEDAGDP